MQSNDVQQAGVTTPLSRSGEQGGESVYRSILRENFGHPSFRGIQQDIVESIGAGHDTLGLMPTGGGKSITFQVPALAKEGICLVISPLIALMKDQVTHLREKGIKAAAIYTGMTRDEVIVTLENCIFGNYKFLYVSPERLSSELFLAKLSHMQVSFVTVDEAHCISQWGYDFRPSYLKIAQIRQLLPHAPILALTATATPAVVEDIQRQLHFSRPNVKRMSFARPNLVYSVRRIRTSREQEVERVLKEVEGSSIVYTRSRAGTYELAEWLNARGVTATFFHAGLTNREKTERAAAWQRGDIRVMVATNAFGMGIDKADVRSVIHADVPDSPEAYFQEAGRAGRDGQRACAVLLYDEYSIGVLKRRIEDTYPPEEYVAQVYEDVCCFLQMAIGDGYGVTREFSLEDFCRSFRHFPVRAYNALQLLTRAGFIEYTDAEENRSRVMMTCQRDELYNYHFPPAAEHVLWHLLRTCTGIFAEFAFIEEGDIAVKLGMAETEVSEALIVLSRMHVVRFVPRKYIPYVTFTQRRLDRDEVVLPRTVYEDRKREMTQRVQTMIGYLKTDGCRSRYLLNYFGETDGADCGQCDNCAELSPTVDMAAVYQRVVTLLQSHGVLPVRDIRFADIPDHIVAEVLQQMFDEEQLAMLPDGLRVRLV